MTTHKMIAMILAASLLSLPVVAAAIPEDLQQDMLRRQEQQQRDMDRRNAEARRMAMEDMQRRTEENRQRMQQLEDMNRQQAEDREKAFREIEARAREQQLREEYGTRPQNKGNAQEQAAPEALN